MAAFRELLGEARWELDQKKVTLRRVSPYSQVVNARQRVDDLLRRALAAMRHDLALRRSGVTGMSQTLFAVGPPAVLARGYAVVTRTSDGNVVRQVDQVSTGDRLRIRVSDGIFPAQVGEGMKSTSPTEET